MRRFTLCLFFIFLLSPSLSEAKALYEHVNLENEQAVEKFYEETDGEPRWVDGDQLSDDGKELLKTLQNAWQHGLNPATYHVKEVEGILAKEEGFQTFPLPERMMALELMLTDGYVRYARDLSGMRIKSEDMGLRPRDWRGRMTTEQALLKLKNNIDSMSVFLLELEPRSKTYQALKEELIQLKSNEALIEPAPLSFKGLVVPGKGYNDIPMLRERMGSPEVAEHDLYTYDEDLAAAVIKFQSERGLKPDGIIGERTLFALNLTRKDKIKQIVANLERLRWMPDEKPDRFIVVNLPSAMLWALDHGEVVFEMPVIVGRPKRETVSFVTEVHGVRFNPTWTVPPTIKQKDILPQLQEDPAYFLDKGMELFDGRGEDARTIDPTTVDWKSMKEEDVAKLHMVQIPGAHNPLGAIRILMPNEYNIYLHDTNHHSLFDKYDRALSSGCIRMKYPEKVADFILSYKSGWKFDNMKTILESGKTKDIYVDEKMPVYLLYYTAWLDPKGVVVYGMDIYQHDKKLLQLLEKVDGISI